MIHTPNGDIAPYSEKEAQTRKLEKDIERLEAAISQKSQRNSYRLSERLRMKQAELSLLINNVVPIEGTQIMRKEILWSAATKRSLTHMATGIDLKVGPFMESQLELIAAKGVDYQSLLNENDFLRATLIRCATEAEAFISGFEDDDTQEEPVDELLTFLRTIIAK